MHWSPSSGTALAEAELEVLSTSNSSCFTLPCALSLSTGYCRQVIAVFWIGIDCYFISMKHVSLVFNNYYHQVFYVSVHDMIV